MTKLLLVDGSALLHRAYHAYPPLTTKSGQVVGAVYGVVSILSSALVQINPTHVVVAWDLPKPTFRHEKYIGYKAQRPKAEESMVEQIPLVKEMISAMNITQLARVGYEADDIIGTLSTCPAEQIVILTGDQDTMQLVNERVSVMTPAKGRDATKIYDPQEVIQKYGVKPEQIVDYKALIGDPSDNIPGVAGIGPKTAAKLIAEYGTLEQIYQNLDKIEDKLREKLKIGKDSAYLSQELSRIEIGVSDLGELAAWEYSGYTNGEMKKKLEEYGFRSLIRRMYPGESDSPTAKVKKDDNQMELFG